MSDHAVHAIVLVALAFAIASAGCTDSADDAEGSLAPEEPAGPSLSTIDGIANVDNGVFGADAVWVSTSSKADNFSTGETDAGIIRLDPTTGTATTILAGLDTEPTFVAFGDQVWAELDNRVIAFDTAGREVAQVTVDASGALVAGDRYLWATGFAGGLSVIDPAAANVIAQLETVRFPVSPVEAFGHVWVPRATDGTVTVLDIATLGETTSLTIEVSPQMQTNATAVSEGSTGAEVWITDLVGDLYAIEAEGPNLGAVRQLPLERAINQVIPAGASTVLLPTWGQLALIVDSQTAEVIAEVEIETIPVRAVVDGGMAWVSGDGITETLTEIDVATGEVVEHHPAGLNRSNTTGPTTPFIVGDHIWVTNRGDDTIVVVDAG